MERSLLLLEPHQALESPLQKRSLKQAQMLYLARGAKIASLKLESIDVNLMGAYWMAQAFAKANKDGGVIVNISSILGIKPQGLPQAAYASSKAGLIGLTRDLAAQWTGRKKIRVNALAPGFFPSEMSDELPKDMVEMLKMFAPAGRLGEPEELAATLIWLVSDASSYVTGITVPVDGGLVMP